MSTAKKNDHKNKDESEWNDRAREIWLAGLGALSAVEEEGVKLFHMLIDRGTEFEKKRKEQMEEMWEDVSDSYKKIEKRVGKTLNKTEETLEKNVISAIKGMGLPSRSEVEKLSKKVDALNKRLDNITGKLATSGTKKAKTSSSKPKPSAENKK
ncbi:MAG: phasin family protein [Balneolales bacterium]